MPAIEVTLMAGQRGVYEEQIDEDRPLRVTVEDGNYQSLQIVHHEGDRPIYVAVNQDIQVRDSGASIVLPGTWLIVPTAEAASFVLTVVSSSAATVSVVRL